MSACTFFGHRDSYRLNKELLYSTIEGLIDRGVDVFYVGHQGWFDSAVLECLKQLQKLHSNICYAVVLARLPAPGQLHDPYAHCSIYPEGLEDGVPRFALERRNKWMIDKAEHCICYVNHSWGGAYKFACLAKRHGLNIINLGCFTV